MVFSPDRLHREKLMPIILIMERKTTKTIKFFLCALLVLALLTGCSVSPSPIGAKVTPDADASGESSPDSEVSAGTPRNAVVIPAAPLSEVLSEESGCSIIFVNVGRADAAIIRFGETAVLIDTGSADSVPQLFAGLNALGVSYIDAVFITHSHEDHLGGLDALSANYDISMVYSPYYGEADKNGVNKVQKRVEKLGLPYRALAAGDILPVADGVSFAILGPLRLNEEDDNDNSLVLRFSYDGKTFLFTGDMQFAEEQDLIDSGADLKSDVLKVGNHGNPDATGEAFAALVSPSRAVISTDTVKDKNSANPRVLAALRPAYVYITQDFPIGMLMKIDESGNIAVYNPTDDSSLPPATVESFDFQEQTVTLINRSSADADLSGCVLFSARTGAALRFPVGTMLPTGGSLTVGNGEVYAFPGEEKPLKKKDNTVSLYSPFGSLIDERND